MKRKKRKVKDYHAFYVHLRKLLNVRYSPWEQDLTDKERAEGNVEAKEILYSFYRELSSARPSGAYEEGRYHTSYFLQLFPIRKAFEEENYLLVCWDLQSLLHYEPFLQPRIYYNVLNMLEHYLDIEGEIR